MRYGNVSVATVVLLVPILLLVGAAGCAGPMASAPPVGGSRAPDGFAVLVFSRTAGFRHDSIPAALVALERLASTEGFTVVATEDPAVFTAANLDRFDAVMWLSTTGDVLDGAQQSAFEQYLRGGGGYVGVHSAADTEYDWPWYGGLVGAYFRSHPAVQPAIVRIEDAGHPSTAGLPSSWSRSDEWYDFRINPRPSVHVLATVDESTYDGGTMGGDHPLAWCHEYDGGRAWYTGMGHTADSYSDSAFLRHLLGGIRYAALGDGTCTRVSET
jgi:type 1 glutamine amidotransferase